MSKENTPRPQKRHSALVPLSHDHHHGLMLCWKIRTGFSKGVETQRIADYVKHFFDIHLKKHFNEEEEILLIRLEKENKERQETEYQHRELYGLRNKLEDKNERLENVLRDFEKKLEAHIRFEERKLFPYLQKTFNEDQLTEIQLLLEKEEPFEDDWEDVFWSK